MIFLYLAIQEIMAVQIIALWYFMIEFLLFNLDDYGFQSIIGHHICLRIKLGDSNYFNWSSVVFVNRIIWRILHTLKLSRPCIWSITIVALMDSIHKFIVSQSASHLAVDFSYMMSTNIIWSSHIFFVHSYSLDNVHGLGYFTHYLYVI